MMSSLEDLYARGLELHRTGDCDSARALYQQLLELDPNHVKTLYLIATLAIQQNAPQSALAYLDRAIEIAPRFAELYTKRGIAFHQLGRFADAVVALQAGLQLDPQHAESYYQLGRSLAALRQDEEARQAYRVAHSLSPHDPRPLNNLGNLEASLGQHAVAIDLYQKAIDVDPRFAEAYYNLGSVYQKLQDDDRAFACYRKAIELRTNFVDAHYNRALILDRWHRHPEAFAEYQLVTRLDPSSAAAWFGMVHQQQHLCCWENLEFHASEALKRIDELDDRTEGDVPAPFHLLALPIPTTCEQQQKSAAAWYRRLSPQFKAPFPPHFSTRDTAVSRRLKIGYLSSDFREHAVGWLLPAVIAKHDRERFCLYGYALGTSGPNSYRRKLTSAMDEMREFTAETEREIAEQIYRDEIDILVDLNGHTFGGRPGILARRPAPIQIGYLGYPGTMGAEFLDYLVVDSFVVRPEDEVHYTERLIKLPGTYFPFNNSTKDSLETAAIDWQRRDAGLPDQGIVFCSFNVAYKLTPQLFSGWMRIMKQVSSAVLWLPEYHPIACDQLRAEATRHGIDPRQLIFAPRVADHASHLSRLKLADIALDTFPYNGHTTTSDALLAGVPVVTLVGQTWASRVAGGILQSLGLGSWANHSLEAYEHMAVELAFNEQGLAAYRNHIGQALTVHNREDGRRYTRNLEAGFLAAWDQFRTGTPPRSIVLPGD